MSKKINIGGRIHSIEVGNVAVVANEVLDDTKGKKQNVINSETDAELLRLDQSKQNNLTFDNTPTENSNNPVKSSGVYAADKALSDAIDAILILIPSAATALNQLADKNFVNSSIATDTATFRGTSETGLSEAQFLEWANGLTHDMNDYVFWQTIDEAGNTLFKRYKWNGTQWLYEYTLNNSSFTADQWAAIMSGITSALVEKLNGLPTNTALQQALNSKQDALTFDNVPTENSTNPVKSGGVYSAVKAEEDARLNLAQTVSEIGGDVSQIEDVIPTGATSINKLVENASMEAYVASIIQNITASFTLSTTDGHINLTLTQVNGRVATLTLSSSDIASAQALTALTGRVTTAEGNITSLTGRVSTNETDIANLQQLYNDLQQSKPVPVTALPETGQQQGVIYRLAGTTSYSDYMWNGSSWVLMATYDNAIDDEPTAGSDNLVKSGGVSEYAYSILCKDDCWLYNNHVENSSDGTQHEVIEDDRYDSIIFLVKGKKGSLHINGLSPSHSGNERFSAFNTENKKNWNTGHFVGYNSLSSLRDSYVPIIDGAVIYVLPLYKAYYPNGYDDIKIVYKSTEVVDTITETKLVNFGTILSPDTTEDGYIINSSGEKSANASYRICTYNINNAKKYALTADVPANYGANIVHYYNGDTYLGYDCRLYPHPEGKNFVGIILDIPTNTTKVKIVETKADSRIYRLQEYLPQNPNIEFSKYLAEGIVLYPYCYTSIYNNMAYSVGERTIHTLVIDINPEVNAIFIDKVEVTRVVFCSTWSYGYNAYLSYLTSNLKGIIKIPEGCKKCVVNINSSALDINNLNIPIQYFYRNEDKRILTNKVVTPNDVQKGKAHESASGEIISSASWNLFGYNIDAKKSYAITAKMVNTSMILVHYHDSNNNWLGYDIYKGESLPSKVFDNVMLHIPYNAAKMYVNVETGFEGTVLRVFGEETNVALRKKTIVSESEIIPNKGILILCGEYVNSTGEYHYNVFEYTVNPSKDYVLTATLPNTTSVFAVYYDANGVYISDDIYYGKGVGETELDGVLLHIPSNAAILRVNGYSNEPYPVLQELGSVIDITDYNEETDNIPSYYKDYINTVEENIQKTYLLSEPLSDAFTFITDIHYPNVSGNGFKLIRHILDNTPVDKAVCGGDIDGASATEFGSETEVIEAIQKTRILFDKDCGIVRGSGKPLFVARGNHDYSLSKYGNSSQSGNYVWYADWTATRNIIMNCMEQYGIVTNYDDDKACYFYKDYPSRKLRYIYVDTVDTNEVYGDTNNSQVIGLTDTQIQWLIEQAVLTTPQNYDIVFVSHICPEAIAGGRETVNGQKSTQFKKLSDMLTAIQEKTTLNLTLSSIAKTYDLTSFNPDILLYKSGHLHKDGIGWYGYWGFGSAAEWSQGGGEIGNTWEYVHFDIDVSRNTLTSKYSVYESLLDVLFINGRENVLSFRVGAGVNRIFVQEQVTVSAGNTVTLESSLGSSVKWWCYDSQNIDFSLLPSGGWKNDYAEINENTGVLTAKTVSSPLTLPSYVTAMAYDEDKNTIEYFGIKVV